MNTKDSLNLKIIYPQLFPKFGILLISILTSLQISFLITEKYFFNELFLQKSCIHGYQNESSMLCAGSMKKSINKRVTNITNIFLDNKPLDKNKFTIALIGDSFVYGLGVRDDQRFGKILEKKLNKIKPTKILNLGLEGDHVIDSLVKFQYLEKNYDIDLYIITILDNDLFIDSLDRYKNSKETYDLIVEKCPGNSYDIPNYGDNPESFLHQLLPQNNNSCLYKEFLNILESSKKPIIFFSYDNVSRYTESISSEYDDFFSTYNINTHKEQSAQILLKFLIDEAKKRSFKTVDTSNIDSNYHWEKISDKEWHPSASAHQFFSESLYREIIKQPSFKN